MGSLRDKKILCLVLGAFLLGVSYFLFQTSVPSRRKSFDQVIRVLTPARVSNLNLVENFDPFLWRVRHLVFSNLLEWDGPSQSFKPALATQWNHRGNTLRFTLDPQKRWHDNRPVTVADVLFSVNIQIGAQSKSLYQGMFQEIIDSVRVVDARTFEIKTKTPSSYHLRAIGDRLQIYPQHVYSDPEARFAWPRRWVGSGPYRVFEFNADKNLFLQDVAQNKGIDIQFVPSLEMRRDLIRKGQSDWAEITWRESLRLSAEDQNLVFKKDIQSEAGVVWLLLNHQNPHLAQTKVRQALMHGFDRAQISRQIFNRQLRPAASYWPTQQKYAAGLLPYKYDVEKAKRLLSEAGYDEKKGKIIEFEVMVMDPEDAALADLFAKSMEKLGIKARQVSLGANEAYRRIEEGRYDAYVMSMPRFYDDMNLRFQFHSQKSNPWPVFKFSPENQRKVDRLTEKIEKEYAVEKRVSLQKELDAVLYEEVPHLFWFEIPYEYWLRGSSPPDPIPPW